jgi:antitoxin MazE
MLIQRVNAIVLRSEIVTTQTLELDIDTNINQWGNGLAVRINKAIAGIAGVVAGTPVRIHAERGRIVIETTQRQPTLDEMLESFDLARHGGEAMALSAIGAEVIE